MIIITGQRQDKSLAEEPASVVVVTAETIEAQAGADRLDQILAFVPNVQLGSGGEGPTIRGQDSTGVLRDLPAFLGGTRPRMTLQVDGRPVGYNELAFGTAGLWDVDQIEIFRSPQTTTQGRNSIAGAIFIETVDPSWEWHGRARVSASEGQTRQASVVLSGPIIPSQLAVRFAGDAFRSRTSSEITSTSEGANYNRDTYEIARFKLLAAPNAAPGLRILATATYNHSSAPQIEGVRMPFRDRQDPIATYGFFKVRVAAVTLRTDYDISDRWHAKVTVTAGDAKIRRFAPTGFGEATIAGHDDSLEGLLTWRRDPKLSILVGFNQARVILDQQINLSAALLGSGRFIDRQRSIGLFGHVDWEVAPHFELSGGIRYQQDHQQRRGALRDPNHQILALDYRERFARLLPKLAASFELHPGIRIGAQVQRAYNPGGVTLDPLLRVPDAFGPETLWAYEVFFRAFAPESPVTMSANAFYYDIKNAQRTIQREIQSPGGLVTIAEVANAPAAKSYGLELQAKLQVSPRLVTTMGAGFLRTRLTRTLSAADPLLDNEFQRAPAFTASAGATWTPMSTLKLSLQARHNSSYFSDDANTQSRRVSDATVVDLGANWKSGRVTLDLYVRNVFDKFYLTYLYSPNARLATAGDPRTIGGSVGIRF